MIMNAVGAALHKAARIISKALSISKEQIQQTEEKTPQTANETPMHPNCRHILPELPKLELEVNGVRLPVLNVRITKDPEWFVVLIKPNKKARRAKKLAYTKAKSQARNWNRWRRRK